MHSSKNMLQVQLSELTNSSVITIRELAMKSLQNHSFDRKLLNFDHTVALNFKPPSPPRWEYNRHNISFKELIFLFH